MIPLKTSGVRRGTVAWGCRPCDVEVPSSAPAWGATNIPPPDASRSVTHHGIAGQLDRIAVDGDREPGRAPLPQRLHRRVGVDRRATDHLGLVGDPVHQSRSRSSRYRESAARSPHRRRSASGCRRRGRRPRRPDGRDPDHPGEVVSSPTRDTSSGVAEPARAPPTLPISPSPLITTGISPVPPPRGLLASMLQPRRHHGPVAHAPGDRAARGSPAGASAHGPTRPRG